MFNKNEITYTLGKIVHIYIVYEINLRNYRYSDDLTLGNCLFSTVKLVINADIDKYKYSGYGIWFDVKGTFGFLASGYARNVIIFGVDMSSSPHIDNKIKDILILRKGLTQGLEHTPTVQKMFPINFTEHNKISV